MKDAGSQLSESSCVDVPKQLNRTDIHVTVVRVEREESEQEHGCRLLVKLSTGDYGWLCDSQMSLWQSSHEAFDEWWECMQRLREQLAAAGKKKKAKRRASEEEAYGARPKRRKRPSKKAPSTRVCGQKDASGSSEDSSNANGWADELEEAEEDAKEHQIEAVDSPSGSQDSSEANGWADELQEAAEDVKEHQIEAVDSPSDSEGSSEANGAADELEEAEEDTTDHSLDVMDSSSGSESSSEANGAADELEEADEDAEEHQMEAMDSPSTAAGEGVDQDEPTDQFASSSGPAEREDDDEDMEGMPTCVSIATFDYLNEPPGTLLVRAEVAIWGSGKEAAIAKRCKGLEETLQMPFNDSWPVGRRIRAIWQKMIDDKYVC